MSQRYRLPLKKI